MCRYLSRLSRLALLATLAGCIDAARGALEPEGSDPQVGLPSEGSQDEQAHPPPSQEEPPPPAKEAPACLRAGEIVHPTSLSTSFTAACAGCHGDEGEGRAAFPRLAATALPFDTFLSSIRLGALGMPAFDELRYSTARAFEDWISLIGQSEPAPRDLGCLETPDAGVDIDAVISAGLKVWTRPDVEGDACVDCHTPDGFDLAYLDYRDSDILRRALHHVDEEDGLRIVDMVHAMRSKYDISPVDPREFRPLQPGGVVLAGPEERFERDHLYRGRFQPDGDRRFFAQLAEATPTLSGPPIRSLAAARAARDELAAIEPRTFPLGIAFDRWTEDGFHGVRHQTTQEWITPVAMRGDTPAAQAAIEAARARYLQAPSWEYVLALAEAIREGISTTSQGRDAYKEIFKMARDRYAGAQIMQHLFRVQATTGVTWDMLPHVLSAFGDINHENPVWEVGFAAKRAQNQICRPNQASHPDEDYDCSTYQIPPVFRDATGSRQVLYEDVNRMRMTWFYAGFLLDQSLHHSGSSNSTKSGEYFQNYLIDHGYFAHAMYNKLVTFVARTMRASQGAEEPSHRVASHLGLQWKHFPNSTRYRIDTGTDRDADLRKYASNAARMFAYLAIEDAEQHGPPADGDLMIEGGLRGCRTGERMMLDHVDRPEAESHDLDLMARFVASMGRS